MSKVGAISKAQKRKTFFWRKIEIFQNFFLSKKSHCAKNCKRGTLLDLLTYIPLQNIEKLEGGTLWRQKKFEKKVAQCRKNSKGDPIVSSGFVSVVRKGGLEPIMNPCYARAIY